MQYILHEHTEKRAASGFNFQGKLVRRVKVSQTKRRVDFTLKGEGGGKRELERECVTYHFNLTV